MGKRHRQPHHRAPAAPTPHALESEKEVQRDVYRLYVALGCEVIWFSQPRETMQTRGIPDLKVYCRRKGLTWWHETKSAGGKQTPEQVHFEEIARACGERYILGGWERAVDAVRVFGLVAPEWRPARLGA